MNKELDLNEIEGRLRQSLKNRYEKAQIPEQLIFANAYVHTALEDAFRFHLGERENEFPDFSDKARAVLPVQFEQFNISDLNKRRNQFAHPKRDFREAEIKNTADGFAQFAVASWTDLFGFTSQPPVITPPVLSTLTVPTAHQKNAGRTNSLPAESVQKVTVDEPKQKVPWRLLIGGLALLFAIFWLGGIIQQVWLESLTAWYWLLLLAGLTLFLFLATARNFWRFFRAVGFTRALNGIIILFALATVMLIPWSEPAYKQGSRAGAALDRLLKSLEPITVGTAKFAFTQGKELANQLFPEGAGELLLENEPTRTPRPTTVSPTVTATTTVAAQPSTISAPLASSTPFAPLTIGMRVIVNTGAGRLRLRTEPSTSSDIVTPLENGTELTIVGGPQTAGGFTWWEVEGAAGRGWSAGQFLAPITSSE